MILKSKDGHPVTVTLKGSYFFKNTLSKNLNFYRSVVK